MRRNILTMILTAALFLGNSFVLAEESESTDENTEEQIQETSEPVETGVPIEEILEDDGNQNVVEEECKEKTNQEIEDVIEISEDSNDSESKDISLNEANTGKENQELSDIDYTYVDSIEIETLSSVNHSRDEAVAWINDHTGWCEDYDRIAGEQCVDLIKAYMDYLVGYFLTGYAYVYADRDDLPDGWYYTSNPSPGDIAAWKKNVGIAGSDGHVALVKAVGNGTFDYIDINGATHTAGSGTLSNSNPSTFIHPDFPTGPRQGTEMTQGYDRVLPDGDYVIVSALDTSYFLDIIGTDYPAKQKANVGIWKSTNNLFEATDSFTIKYNSSDKFYSIVQRGTSMSLDSDGCTLDEGANIHIWPRNDSKAQKWAISEKRINDEIRGYTIQAACSSFCLDIDHGTMENGRNVQAYTRHSDNSLNQVWLFIPYEPEHTLPDGKYIIVPAVNTNFQVDVAGNTLNNNDGTNVQIWYDSDEYWYSNVNSKYNAFNVKQEKGGYYRIELDGTGTSLDVNGCNPASKANIQIWSSNSSNAQLWAITKYNNGYLIRSRCSGFTLDLYNGEAKSGTNVQQWPFNGGQNQTWYFVPAEYLVRYYDNYSKKYSDNYLGYQTKYYKGYLTLLDAIPERDGYKFINWNTESDGSGTSYSPGDKILEDKILDLYAQWASVRSLGDVTGEGNIDVSDIIKIRDIILGEANTISTLSEDDRKMADVNVDGKVDVSDIILVRDRILGVVDEEYKKIKQ